MHKKLGVFSSLITFISVLLYALCMFIITIFENEVNMSKVIYFTSILIALGFLSMIYAYFSFMKDEDRGSGLLAVIISIIYSILFIIIHHNLYFRMNIDTFNFELFFNMKMFGYLLVSISIFFISFTLEAKNKKEHCLKLLMNIHFLFGICFLVFMIEMLLDINIIQSSLYRIIIKFWCLYFSLICILSFCYFKKKATCKNT